MAWLDHNVQIHMLDTTVAEQFYMKKRNFQFVVVDEAFDRHNNKAATQNKYLQQQLVGIRGSVVELLLKYDFGRIFSEINSKFDGSEAAKQAATAGALIAYTFIKPFLAKQSFGKLILQLFSNKTTKLDRLSEERLKEIRKLVPVQAINRFIFNYLLFHTDFICNAFTGSEDCVKIFQYEVKRITQTINKSSKQLGELFSSRSTSAAPFEIENNNTIMNNLSDLLSTKLQALCHGNDAFITLTEHDLELVTLDNLL